MQLLEPQAFTFNKQIANILLLFALKFIWYTFITTFLGTVIFTEAIDRPSIFFMVLIGPMAEELLYRYIPITIANQLGKGFLLPIILLSSMIFGFNHGHGLVSLLIQGVGGLMYCILYIRNNYSYWSCVVVHSTWNLFTLF